MLDKRRAGDTVSDNRLLTKTEVAARLGVSERTVDRLVKAGELRKHPLAKQPKFTIQEIDRYLAGEQPEDVRRTDQEAGVKAHSLIG